MGTRINKKELLADMSMVFVALSWGGGFVVLKDALDNITPFYVMAIRFTLAFLMLSLIFFRKLKKINKEYIKIGSLIGVFLFFGFATQTLGLKYTTAGKNAFLTGTNVVIVPFLYWIIAKHKPDIYSFIGAFLTIIGIGCLTLQKDLSINIGDILTLICAIFFAAHIVTVGHYAKDRDPIVLTIIQIGAAAILFIIATILFEPINLKINSGVVRAILYLVVFSTVMAFLLQNVAQKYTTSTHASIILSLESVFGSLLSTFILKENFSMKMIIGNILIFSAIIITETKPKFNLISFKKKVKTEVEEENKTHLIEDTQIPLINEEF